jgi:peptide/nickel transport system permease protein
MPRFVLRRLLLLFPALWVLSLIAFGLVKLLPGDPVTLQADGGMMMTPQQIEAIRTSLYLDRPVPEQYLRWVGNVLTGNLGNSFISGQPVAHIILQRAGPTLVLTGAALVISVVLGVIFGLLAARWRNSLLDHSLTVVAFFFVSVPGFWAAILAIILFAVVLRVLPAGGMVTAGQDFSIGDVLLHAILPATVLGLEGTAAVTRYVRSAVIEVLSEDYIRTARAKGLSEMAVLSRHAIRPALLPVVTIVGLRLPGLLGGAVLIERVFSWPGLGREAVTAAYTRDIPVTMALVLATGALTIFGSLIADIAYGALDPRIRQATT